MKICLTKNKQFIIDNEQKYLIKYFWNKIKSNVEFNNELYGVYIFLCFITNCNKPYFYFKIGYSNNIMRRKNELNYQYKCYGNIFLIGYYKTEYRFEEKYLHKNIPENYKKKLTIYKNDGDYLITRETYKICNDIYDGFINSFVNPIMFLRYRHIIKYIKHMSK